ncbi:MAG: winged helix DNA-binding domain-containing protein [Actinomycetes bacterium]
MDVLTLRGLNRATLHRQRLLARCDEPVPDVLEHLVGLQAQVPDVPYLALWSRLRDFDPEPLAELMRTRQAVRMPLMRATIHLVTAQDGLALRPVLHPVLARTFAGTTWGQALASEDMDAILAAGQALVEERPRTRATLGALLRERWPHADPAGLALALTYLVAVVQVTPRGVWSERGQATWTTVTAWLGGEPGSEPGYASGAASREDVLLRYLAAFGPATVKDAQMWCGLTRLREVADGLGERLRRFRTEEGADLLDVPDGPLPDPDTPAPPRFLPEYDNALLSYADRTRVVRPGDHVLLRGGSGGHVGTVLVDGFLSATWALRRTGSRAVLEVRPSRALGARERAAVSEEGARLLAFLASDADHDIRVHAPP